MGILILNIFLADALKELGYYFDNNLRLRRLSTDAYGDSTDIPVDPFATVNAISRFVFLLIILFLLDSATTHT